MLRPTLALLLLSCLPAGVAANPTTRTTKPKQLNVRITYLDTIVSLDQNSQNGSGKLSTTWYTPAGSRMEMANGETTINLKDGSFIYLYPESKTALRLDKKRLTSSSPSSEEAKVLARITHLMDHMTQRLHMTQRPSRRERFLGRECEVAETSMQTSEGLVRITSWTAQVGGHSIGLRALSRTYKGGELAYVSMHEAISIQTVPTVPSGLLQAPADYSVSEVTPDMLVGLEQSMKKAILPPGDHR